MSSRTCSFSRHETTLAAARADEDAVDRRPQPRVVHAGGVVEDLARVEQAGGAVVEDDVGDRQQVGEPLLVEREDGDHDEEVEVRLDPAVPEVDEDRRARQQAERHGAGADAPAQTGMAAEEAQRGDRQDLDRAVHEAVVAQQAEGEEQHDVQPDQPHHRAVPGQPDVGRQGAPTGKLLQESRHLPRTVG